MPRGITTVFAALCLVGSALAVRARGGSREQPPAVRSERAAFAAWKVVHGVTYDSADEEEREFVQWLENDASIRSHNAAAVGWELGHNVYSSHSWEQFQWKMGIGLGERKQAREASPIGAEHRAGDYAGDTPALRATLEKARRAVGAASEAGREWESVLGAKLRAPSALLGTNPRVPESRDWVAEGGVSPVNNQANCGSVRRRNAPPTRAACHVARRRAYAPTRLRALLPPRPPPALPRAVLVLRSDRCGRGALLRDHGRAAPPLAAEPALVRLRAAGGAVPRQRLWRRPARQRLHVDRPQWRRLPIRRCSRACGLRATDAPRATRSRAERAVRASRRAPRPTHSTSRATASSTRA